MRTTKACSPRCATTSASARRSAAATRKRSASTPASAAPFTATTRHVPATRRSTRTPSCGTSAQGSDERYKDDQRGWAAGPTVAFGHHVADELNLRAREQLGIGQHGEQRLTCGRVELVEGDRIVCKRNSYAHHGDNERQGADVYNNDLGVVRSVAEDHITIQLDRGPTVRLGADHAADHIRYGYA